MSSFSLRLFPLFPLCIWYALLSRLSNSMSCWWGEERGKERPYPKPVNKLFKSSFCHFKPVLSHEVPRTLRVCCCFLQMTHHVITSHRLLIAPRRSCMYLPVLIQVSMDLQPAQCKWLRRTILTQAMCRSFSKSSQAPTERVVQSTEGHPSPRAHRIQPPESPGWLSDLHISTFSSHYSVNPQQNYQIPLWFLLYPWTSQHSLAMSSAILW